MISLTVAQLLDAAKYIEEHNYIPRDVIKLYQPTEIDTPVLITRA